MTKTPNRYHIPRAYITLKPGEGMIVNSHIMCLNRLMLVRNFILCVRSTVIVMC